jgi:hypothetical protein
MRKRKLNKLSLLADLRKMLARPDTRVLQRRQLICGRSTWVLGTNPGEPPVSQITIYLDPRRDGKVKLVIHELLHIRMQVLLGIDHQMVYELEEAAILAWENKLYEWLHSPMRHAALEAWNQAIERKMR